VTPIIIAAGRVNGQQACASGNRLMKRASDKRLIKRAAVSGAAVNLQALASGAAVSLQALVKGAAVNKSSAAASGP
jgi:hypothetical protein